MKKDNKSDTGIGYSTPYFRIILLIAAITVSKKEFDFCSIFPPIKKIVRGSEPDFRLYSHTLFYKSFLV